MSATVYHSNCLPSDYPAEFRAIQAVLLRHGLPYNPISATRDVWCRDYMPVPATDGSLIQFVYWPRYLRSKGFANLITNPCCYRNLPFADHVRESVLILDGGAIEIYGKTGIVTERVFEDNYWYGRAELMQKLRTTLALKTLIVIPVEPKDETGHVDGVVRLMDEQSVIMNDYDALEADLLPMVRRSNKPFTSMGSSAFILSPMPRTTGSVRGACRRRSAATSTS